MSQSPKNKKPPLHSFDSQGMNTLFTIRIHHKDVKEARRMAGNCFCRLEEIEAQLSRYRIDSDVTRINQLKAGQSMLLTDVTYRCLQRSVEATIMTAGLFDVTLGAQTWRTDVRTDERPKGKLTLSPDRPEILCEEAGREIDFGGIGKGFALDEMAELLRDLGVKSALLSCGASTHLAVGERYWPMALRGDKETFKIDLNRQALSASGISEQGAHVVHPDTGAPPDYSFQRVWVVAPSAGICDALSTACLIMDEEEVAEFAKATAEEGIFINIESALDHAIRNVTP